MKYKTRAMVKDGHLTASLNLNMEGSWYINVSVLLPDGKVTRVNLEFKVGVGHGDHGH